MAQKLILKNLLSPGDIVALTAAVRDLHKCYPDQFITDVRTPCPHLWENNPFTDWGRMPCRQNLVSSKRPTHSQLSNAAKRILGQLISSQNRHDVEEKPK